MYRVATALLVVLAGCVTASTSSLVNRDLVPDDLSASPVLIWLPVADLGLRTSAERAFVEELGKFGGQSIAAVDVFFPGQEYTPEQMLAAIESRGIASIVTVSVLSAENTQAATGISTCIQTDASGRCVQAIASASPQSIPANASFQFSLYGLRVEGNLWVATVETKNNAGAATEVEDMVLKAMRAAAQQLAQDGLIRSP